MGSFFVGLAVIVFFKRRLGHAKRIILPVQDLPSLRTRSITNPITTLNGFNRALLQDNYFDCR